MQKMEKRIKSFQEKTLKAKNKMAFASWKNVTSQFSNK